MYNPGHIAGAENPRLAQRIPATKVPMSTGYTASTLTCSKLGLFDSSYSGSLEGSMGKVKRSINKTDLYVRIST